MSGLPAWLPLANRLVRGLNRLGAQLGTIHVLTVRGRRTGAPRSTPVSPLTVDGKRYVIAGLRPPTGLRSSVSRRGGRTRYRDGEVGRGVETGR